MVAGVNLGATEVLNRGKPMSREAQKTIPTVGEGGVTYMTIRKKMALPAAAALLVLAMMVVASSATATHVRPKGASPFSGATVPAFQPGAAPNGTRAPPLAFPAWNPPVQTSPNLTIGSPDANGAAANSTSFIKLKVVGVAGGGGDTHVVITSVGTDIPRQAGGAPFGSAEVAGGPHHTRE